MRRSERGSVRSVSGGLAGFAEVVGFSGVAGYVRVARPVRFARICRLCWLCLRSAPPASPSPSSSARGIGGARRQRTGRGRDTFRGARLRGQCTASLRTGSRLRRRILCLALEVARDRLGELVLDGGGVSSGAFNATALAPVVGVRRRDWRVENPGPVECDVRVLRFEFPADRFVERFAPDPHVRWRPKPVEHVLPHFPAPVRRRLHEREVLVATPVAREPEERQLLPYFLLLFAADFLAVAAAGRAVLAFGALGFATRGGLATRRAGLRPGTAPLDGVPTERPVVWGRATGAASRLRCTSVKRGSSPTTW